MLLHGIPIAPHAGLPLCHHTPQIAAGLQQGRLPTPTRARHIVPCPPKSQVPSPKSQVPSPKSQVPSPKSQVPSPKSQVPSPKSQAASALHAPPFSACAEHRRGREKRGLTRFGIGCKTQNTATAALWRVFATQQQTAPHLLDCTPCSAFEPALNRPLKNPSPPPVWAATI